MQTVLAGFGLGFSLILAIGAQNAFVLRQGILGQHVLPIVLICSLSDALLISAGVAGFGTLAITLPWLDPVMRYGGAAFLLIYGARAAWSAWQGGATMKSEGKNVSSLWVALTTCLLFTWANPHVYLDTLVLLGTISAQYEDPFSFGLGAVLSSFTFFFSLGFGARFLAPLFARPRAWQVLDLMIAVVMWAIAVSLLR